MLQSVRIINGKKTALTTLSNHVFYYPTPTNLNYNWSFGSLVGIFFAIQIITGIFLAMHYTAHVDFAFGSVEHIMTDVKWGYAFRYFHSNGASMIFIFMYLHIGKGLYYQSYVTRPLLWYSGLVIFLLMMATAFIGYVLPWGQMSFWGATVITSLVTAVPFIGEDIAYWVWGGFSINNATLIRFFSIHYLLPFLIVGIILAHLVLLHIKGSTHPLLVTNCLDKVTFHPYFSYKDAFILSAAFVMFVWLIMFYSNLLGHSDNFITANPLVTPAHIVPEWYFTPFYAILRACPDKIGGAISMLSAILILFLLPFYQNLFSQKKLITVAYTLIHKFFFWVFVSIFFTLMFLGVSPAVAPFIILSKIFTVLYFSYFLVILPWLCFLDDISLS
jgi:ubiquinol-cytochrome c reductase cytochrome b subunit